MLFHSVDTVAKRLMSNKATGVRSSPSLSEAKENED
jgi:hypothetical protein